MPVEANKAAVRRYLEEMWNRRNMSVIDELVDAEFVHRDPASPDYGKGPAGVRRRMQVQFAALPDARITIEDMVAEGDQVATRWTIRATHSGPLQGIAPTGRPVAVTGTTITRLRGGKVMENHSNWDALGLFQQLGMFHGTPRAKREAAG
jgi:steroid delta-isomerase-like uncharacterized protein